MEYRNVGISELRISVITFGAWAIGGWMWGGTDKRAAEEAIRAAYDEGITTIDTAPAYGQGLSEEIIGEAIKGIPRGELQILTKYGLRWDTTRGVYYFTSIDNAGNEVKMYKYAGKESVIKECEESLRRLQTDYIDLYQIHWYDPSTPLEETMEAIVRLREQGKIRFAGVCNFTVEQFKHASSITSIISNQVNYNMLQRDIEADLVPYCLQEGKGILAYSPLARGLLTGKIVPGQPFPKGDHRSTHKLFQPENVKQINEFLKTLKPLAESHNATLAQLVLRWTIDQPGITAALAGARTKEQAVQNAHAVNICLTDEERAFIRERLASFILQV
ncbi:MAG: aldo/keto reductase [Bacteroidetes bacterium]|nr:aldo/keto reductase [Bacteroidota bacterium]